MLDRILFNPENRLLGSSTGDLGLYGGPVDPSLSMREAGTDGLPAEARESASSSDIASAAIAAAGSVAGAVPAQAAPDGVLDTGAGSSIPYLIASPLALAPGVAPVATEGAALPGSTPWQAPAVPAPSGSGSVTPASAPAASASSPAAMAGSAPSDGLIHTMPSDAAILAAAALAPVAAAVPAIGDTVATQTALATDLIETALTHVEGIAVEAGELVENLVTTPLYTPPPLLDDLGDVTASALGAVPPIVDGLADVVTGAVGATTETLSTTVSAAADTLDDIGGEDPAAGVATLVNLVSTADMFDLNPVGAPTIEETLDPGLALLDTLAAELLPDALLGDHADLGGLLGHGGVDLDHLPGL